MKGESERREIPEEQETVPTLTKPQGSKEEHSFSGGRKSLKHGSKAGKFKI